MGASRNLFWELFLLHDNDLGCRDCPGLFPGKKKGRRKKKRRGKKGKRNEKMRGKGKKRGGNKRKRGENEKRVE